MWHVLCMCVYPKSRYHLAQAGSPGLAAIGVGIEKQQMVRKKCFNKHGQISVFCMLFMPYTLQTDSL